MKISAKIEIPEISAKVDKVVILPADEGYIKPKGTVGITENGYYNVKEYEFADVDIPETIYQEKSIEISENGAYRVEADEGFALDGVAISVNVPKGGKLDANGYRTITEVTAEDLAGATKIGNYAFYNCISLERVEIPNGVTSIGDYAFFSCKSIKSVVIPNGVTSLGKYVFNLCSDLVSVEIPDSVTSIGANAFQYCWDLTRVTVKAETPPTIQSSTFWNVSSAMEIYVPAASVDAYKAATNWSARADYIFPIEE